MSSTSPDSNELDAIWRGRREAVEQFWGTFFGGPTMLVLLTPLFVVLHRIIPGAGVWLPWLVWLMGIALLVRYGQLGLRLSRFRCPRCGQQFAWRRFAWTSQCGHCGFRVGESARVQEVDSSTR